MKNLKEVLKVIQPQNELEERICRDPEFIEGCMWGKPRRGHPEGKVLYHIREVLDNVGKCDVVGKDYISLRLIALIHDTFKHKVDRSKPKVGENHHAMIARRFAEKYITDGDVLDIIELHDEAYNSWRKYQKNMSAGNFRAYNLVEGLDENVDLYTSFYWCDNNTGDKTQAPLEWWNDFVGH